MIDLYKNTSYLRGVLREAILDLNDRPNSPKSLLDVMRDSRFCETLLLVLDRLDVLEGKEVPAPIYTPKFQDRSFIIPYAGEELCRPDNRQQAEAAGYEVIGTYSIEAGKPLFKLARRPV